jgi:hypothetical protein
VNQTRAVATKSRTGGRGPESKSADLGSTRSGRAKRSLPAPALSERRRNAVSGASNQALLKSAAQGATGPRLAPKIAVGAIDDPLEREADRAAAQVLRKANSQSLSISASGSLTLQRMCSSCHDDHKEKVVLRKETGTSSGSESAPPSVGQVLSSPGRPLDATSRRYFEPRFGRDLSSVKVHTDAQAATSAGEVDALAYTVGDHVVLGGGQSVANRALMAHELAHVVQQTDAPPVLRRYAPCRTLLDARERMETAVPEYQVRDLIASQAAALGPTERELYLPGASAAPWRTEPGAGRQDNQIDPQIISPDGFGRADVAVLTGSALEIIEVKKADLADPNGVTFGEEQLLNYVNKGNRAIRSVERLWQQRGHPGDSVTSVRAMKMNRWVPDSPQRIGHSAVSLAWCRDGLLSFKTIGDQDQDVFLCGVNDQGRIDSMVDRLFDPAQAEVERLITREIEAKIEPIIEKITIQSVLAQILEFPEIKRLLPAIATAAGEKWLLAFVADQLKPFEAEIRALVRTYVHRVIAEVRRRIQAQIRNMLQESIGALCATAAELTRRQVVEEFRKRMTNMTLQLVPVVASAVLAQMMQQMLKTFGKAMLEAVAFVAAAVVAVLAVIALWEVLAAAFTLEALVAALGSLAAWIARALAGMTPSFG